MADEPFIGRENRPDLSIVVGDAGDERAPRELDAILGFDDPGITQLGILKRLKDAKDRSKDRSDAKRLKEAKDGKDVKNETKDCKDFVDSSSASTFRQPSRVDGVAGDVVVQPDGSIRDGFRSELDVMIERVSGLRRRL